MRGERIEGRKKRTPHSPLEEVNVYLNYVFSFS